MARLKRRMRNLIRRCATPATVALALAGCSLLQSPELADCEGKISAGLRSASYNRIEARSSRFDNLRPPAFWVFVKYDGIHPSGNHVYDVAVCQYPLKDGRADLAQGKIRRAKPL